ncbi:putative Short-branched chain specific acyl-CoA dehydrogenase mitochondrial-like protein, partial [Naja naja]
MQGDRNWPGRNLEGELGEASNGIALGVNDGTWGSFGFAEMLQESKGL